MDVNELFQKNACNIWARDKVKKKWSWDEYFEQKKKLEAEGKKVVLVDMINQPIEDSIPISNEIFFDWRYPDGTTFCLYCHSGWASAYVQTQLEPQLPQYNFVNMVGGSGLYFLMKR